MGGPRQFVYCFRRRLRWLELARRGQGPSRQAAGDPCLKGDPILVVEGAYKTYGAGANEVRALNGVTVQHRAGEVLAILGPSGSGKTTFLMIAGLIDVPSRGRVWYGGRVIASPSTELDQLRKFRQTHIGFVFQRSNLIPFLTALENVQLPMQLSESPRKLAIERARYLLRRLRVDHRANALPHHLSGGEQQRIAIARALANGPRMIF